MVEPSDTLFRLRELPGADPTDAVLRAVVAAGQQRRRHRRLAMAAGLAAVVAALAGGVLIVTGDATTGVTPADSAGPCRGKDLLVAHLAAGTGLGAGANLSGLPVSVKTRRACSLPGPLRLQVRRAAGSWTLVPEGAMTMTGIGLPGGRQSPGRMALDPSVSYAVYLVWAPTQMECPANTLRLSAPGLSLAIGSLPMWCGAPVAVTQTDARTTTRSVAWESAAASGARLTITYRPQCRGVRTDIRETRSSVTVALVTTDPIGPHGCLPIPIGTVRVQATLKQPLGDRRLVHAIVGPWPAISP
jgi:hypothetical protein